MSRRNIARLVLVVWIGALAWLAERQLFQGEASSLTAGAARLSPDARYFRVDAGTLQLGVLNLAWDTLPTGFKVQEMLALDLPAGDATRRHLALTEAVTSRALTLQSASRAYSGASGSEAVEFEVRNDSVQLYRVQSGSGGAGLSSLRRQGPRPSLAAILPLRLAYGGRLSTGQVIAEEVADLERRETRTIRGRVAGDTTFILPDSVDFDTVAVAWRTVTMDTVRAWRLDLDVGGLPERWWVDAQGRLVRLETAFGVTLQRAPFDYSHTLFRDSLRLSGPAPRRALAGVRSLAGAGITLDTLPATVRYRLGRIDGPASDSAVRYLAGGAQSVEGTTLTIRRYWPADTTPAPGGYLAAAGESRAPTQRMRLLADTAFAGAGSARDSVVALTRWIHGRYTVDTNAARHSEPALLVTGQTGTPDALARLAVALARLGGIPARVVAGLAVTPEGLLSHAWAEFWLGGNWVPVDPVSGHAPASARLLRVTEGGLGRPFEALLRTAALTVEPITPGSR